MPGTHVGMEEGFGKNSCAFHKQQVLGKMASTHSNVHRCENRSGVWWRYPNSPKVQTWNQALKSDPMWEAADKSMKQNRLTLLAV